MSLTIKLPFVLIFFAENSPCNENFECGLKITCTKSFFVKLHGRFFYFSVFGFILFAKCFQGCIFSSGNLVKRNVSYRVIQGDLLIEKRIRFFKSQLPDVNLYLIFSLMTTVYFQSLLTALLPI